MDFRNIPHASGIYRIVCTANRRIYIGSSIDLYVRLKGHYNALQRKEHHSITLQRAWDKYGSDAFIFEIIEFVLSPFLLEREQYWLDKLQPWGKKGFNINHSAKSRLGMKASPETIERLRVSHLGNTSALGHTCSSETRIRIGASSKERRHTPQSIEKMRIAGMGREFSAERCKNIGLAKLGMTHRKDSCERMSATKIARYAKTYIVTSPEGIEYTVTGINKFCEKYQLDVSHLVNVAKGKQRTHKGWKARYPEAG